MTVVIVILTDWHTSWWVWEQIPMQPLCHVAWHVQTQFYCMYCWFLMCGAHSGSSQIQHCKMSHDLVSIVLCRDVAMDQVSTPFPKLLTWTIISVNHSEMGGASLLQRYPDTVIIELFVSTLKPSLSPLRIRHNKHPKKHKFLYPKSSDKLMYDKLMQEMPIPHPH